VAATDNLTPGMVSNPDSDLSYAPTASSPTPLITSFVGRRALFSI